jgi:hypothetical protein
MYFNPILQHFFIVAKGFFTNHWHLNPLLLLHSTYSSLSSCSHLFQLLEFLTVSVVASSSVLHHRSGLVCSWRHLSYNLSKGVQRRIKFAIQQNFPPII